MNLGSKNKFKHVDSEPCFWYQFVALKTFWIVPHTKLIMKIIMILRKISQTNNKNKKTKIRHNYTQKKHTNNLCDSALGLCPHVVDNEITVWKKDYKVFTKLKGT